MINVAPNHAGGRSAVTISYQTGVRALSLLVVSCAVATGAFAEDASTATKPAAAAKVMAPATAKTTAPATAAAKPAPAAAATTPVAPVKPMARKMAAPSPCKGLDAAACGSNKACGWIVPKDANDKTGKLQEPYCRKVAGVALKKPMTKPAMAPAAADASSAAKAPAVKAAAKAPVTPPAATAVKPPAPAAAQ